MAELVWSSGHQGHQGTIVMSDNDKLKLRGLRPARIRRPGEPPPKPPPADIVPELRGKTDKLKFVADAAIVDAINDHHDRLVELSPWFPMTASDSIRSLIMEGARSYSTKFRDEPRNEDEHD
jgi:hypothetical protein